MTRERKAALLVGVAGLAFVAVLVLGGDRTAHTSPVDPIPPYWMPVREITGVQSTGGQGVRPPTVSPGVGP